MPACPRRSSSLTSQGDKDGSHYSCVADSSVFHLTSMAAGQAPTMESTRFNVACTPTIIISPSHLHSISVDVLAYVSRSLCGTGRWVLSSLLSTIQVQRCFYSALSLSLSLTHTHTHTRKAGVPCFVPRGHVSYFLNFSITVGIFARELLDCPPRKERGDGRGGGNGEKKKKKKKKKKKRKKKHTSSESH